MTPEPECTGNMGAPVWIGYRLPPEPIIAEFKSLPFPPKRPLSEQWRYRNNPTDDSRERPADHGRKEELMCALQVLYATL